MSLVPISSPGLPRALMEELTAANQISKLRTTSQPSIEANSQEEDLQITAIKHLSEFFISSYLNSSYKQTPPDKPPDSEGVIINHPEIICDDLQDAQRVKHNAMIKEIARMILPAPDKIQTSCIKQLIAYFENQKSCSAEDHLSKALKVLSNSPSISQKLAAIPCPAQNSPGENLIRLSLNLPLSYKVTRLEAQQAVLAALLSHCRQGKSGSCFATFLSIALMGSNLEMCLDDFISLLINNSLTRKNKQFPLNLTMSRERLNQSVTVNRLGKTEKGHYLWEMPGISAASAVLGLQNPTEEVLLALKNLNFHDLDSSAISIDELLLELSKLAHAKKSAEDLSNLIAIAITAYESQTYDPILRAWENAIAGMAEATQNGFIKPQIIDSILFALERKLHHSEPQKQDQDKQVQLKVKSILEARIQLQFFPDIVHGRLDDDDGNSPQGAFVVYDTNNSSQSSHWQAVDNPKKFQDFSQLVLAEAKENFFLSGQGDKDLFDCLDALSTYAITDEFVLQSVKKCGYYQPKSSPANFEHIDTSPWMFKTGTNPKKVLQIYFEMDVAPNPKAHTIRDARHLIAKMAEHISTHQKWLPHISDTDVFLPAAIQGVHVFSILPKHPSLKNLLEQKKDIVNWLEENVEKSGREISSSILPDPIRELVIENCKKSLYFLENTYKFAEEAREIHSEATIKEFRDCILKIVLANSRKDEPPAKAALEIDTIIIQSLPDEQVKELTGRSIRFADTNWFDGIHAVHFCVIVNPGTGNLELWKINDDCSNPMPIDQNYWLLTHPWEFFV